LAACSTQGRVETELPYSDTDAVAQQGVAVIQQSIDRILALSVLAAMGKFAERHEVACEPAVVVPGSVAFPAANDVEASRAREALPGRGS